MSSVKEFQTDEEVVEVLKKCKIEGKTLYLPDIKLERKKYEAVNKVLSALGAKWDRVAKGHVFEYDIKEELENVISTGIVKDWKKTTEFYYTPEDVVNEMIGQVNKCFKDKLKVLEPSAGQGHILDLAKDNLYNAEFIVIENNPKHCEVLRKKGYNPIQEDFIDVKASEVDIVLMNPPFSKEIEHIMHAYDFLGNGGQLISIASYGILDKNTQTGKKFKQWFQDVRGYEYSLPANSFKKSGTGVNTKMIIINKQ